MRFIQTTLPGSYVIEQEDITDERGFFARYFCEKEFSKYDLNLKWVQANNSCSQNIGTLRGLHFQHPPSAEIKLVRCVNGSIWDVIVDLRAGSSTYGQWFGETINSENRKMMYVPRGFAHGTISLEPASELIYLVSDHYNPKCEGQLLWDDPDVNIRWPITPKLISKKDSGGQSLQQIEAIKL